MSWLPKWAKLPERFGLGLIADDEKALQKAGKKDWDFRLLKLSTAEPTKDDQADLSEYIENVLNQGSTSSCVANAWEQAIRIERKRLGFSKTELGSRLFGYHNSRSEHGDEKTDSGTYLRTYAASLKKYGNCFESDYPFIRRKVNRNPPPSAYRKSYGYRGMKGYYKIFTLGATRTDAIRAALTAGKPVVFGTDVDKNFLKKKGPSVINIPRGEAVGGHAMCIVGYKFDQARNEYIYKVVNSWGTGWRDGGYVYFTKDYIQWYKLRDLWVVSLQS